MGVPQASRRRNSRAVARVSGDPTRRRIICRELGMSAPATAYVEDAIPRKGCVGGRTQVTAAAERYLWARSGAHCANPSCRTYLFAEAGDLKIYFGELAHVIAASDTGPRADVSIPTSDRAEPDNIVLLCSICHTTVDKAPDYYPVRMLRDWQRRHMIDIESVFGAVAFETRADAYAAARRLLSQNHAVFETYGRHSKHDQRQLGGEWSRQWWRKVREIILPNNRRLLALYDRNDNLLTDPERAVVELLRQHVDDQEARHFRDEVEPGSVWFPKEVEAVFADG
jgi:hypothetical protein